LFGENYFTSKNKQDGPQKYQFGFFTYATYDLTNLATLKNWPLNLVFIDILWGAVLTSIVSTAGFYIVKYVQ